MATFFQTPGSGQLSEEEKQFKADEEQAIINNENFIKAEETKKAKKESGRQKLKDLGLDDDEIDALTNQEIKCNFQNILNQKNLQSQ